MGVFSVNYKSPDDPDLHSVDWDFIAKGVWARSKKGYMDETWFTPREVPNLLEITKTAYLAVLEHFGLEKWKQEISVERMQAMSPKRLCEIRRMKEIIFGLDRMEILSCTANDHRPAEEFD